MYCGGTAFSAACTCRIGLGLADEVDRARGHDVAGGQLADRRVERLLGQDVRAEDGGQGHDQDPGGDREARDVLAREAGGTLGARRVSMAWSLVLGAQCVPTSWAARSAAASAWTTSSLTCLPSARPRVRGASQPMTLPMSRADEAPVAAIAFADELGELVLGQGCGQVLAEDRDLGLFLGGEVLAAAGPEGLDRLAAGLDLARQDGQELVVGERLALLLLDVVGGARDHPQDVATQRVTAAHRGGDIGLDAILKGHRSGTSGGRATAVAVGRRLARGDQATERSGAGPAQPTCVRAFFLRFASLRLRFTDGFS